MPHPEEEYQISRDKGQVMDAIATFFALADDNVRAGKSLKFCWSRCWNLAGWNLGETLLEPRQNPAGKSVEHCWNSAGTWWNLAGTSLEPCRWNLWLEHFAGNQFGCRFCFSFCISCFAYCVGLWCWKSGLNFAGTGMQPCWNLYEDNFKFFFCGETIRDDDP